MSKAINFLLSFACEAGEEKPKFRAFKFELRLNLVSLQATSFEPRPILEAAVCGTIHLHTQLQIAFQSHCHSLKDFVV
jgi:hypothetical protein